MEKQIKQLRQTNGMPPQMDYYFQGTTSTKYIQNYANQQQKQLSWTS